jgi:hypothetical protein
VSPQAYAVYLCGLLVFSLNGLVFYGYRREVKRHREAVERARLVAVTLVQRKKGL